jgi:hypothetical protein
VRSWDQSNDDLPTKKILSQAMMHATEWALNFPARHFGGQTIAQRFGDGLRKL